MTNKILKIAMFSAEKRHIDVAKILGINHRVFTNKINRRIINGYEARFTEEEKTTLAEMFKIKKSDIE